LLFEDALDNGDDKFFRELAAEIQRQNERDIGDPARQPSYPETALKKVRYAYRALIFEKYREGCRTLNPEILDDVTWNDVKEKTIDFFRLDLTDRRWRELRNEAGLSGLRDRPGGRPKKGGNRK